MPGITFSSRRNSVKVYKGKNYVYWNNCLFIKWLSLSFNSYMLSGLRGPLLGHLLGADVWLIYWPCKTLWTVQLSGSVMCFLANLFEVPQLLSSSTQWHTLWPLTAALTLFQQITMVGSHQDDEHPALFLDVYLPTGNSYFFDMIIIGGTDFSNVSLSSFHPSQEVLAGRWPHNSLAFVLFCF